jgi:hypothetical protein
MNADEDARWTGNARAVLRAAVRLTFDLARGDDPRASAITTASLLNALGTLAEALEVWADNPSNPADLSWGGILPGGIQFGVIARPKDGGVEWTFHS